MDRFESDSERDYVAAPGPEQPTMPPFDQPADGLPPSSEDRYSYSEGAGVDGTGEYQALGLTPIIERVQAVAPTGVYHTPGRQTDSKT